MAMCRADLDCIPVLQISAYDEPALAQVEAELHDWFFDLPDVRHDREAEQVVVPFRRWSYDLARPLTSPDRKTLRSALRRLAGTEWEAPWHRWFLRVENVRDLTVRDEARIGSADFNTVSYDAGHRVLTVECSIPVTLRFEVARLAVHVDETDEILGRARYRTFRDPTFATSYTGEVLPLE